MKFLNNPYDLGLGYHSSGEKQNSDGTVTVRYVLSSPATSEQEATINKFENLKLVKNGCKSKFAPEITYDVLYQNLPSEDDSSEAGFEDLEDQSLAAVDYPDHEEINYLLNKEIDGVRQEEERDLSRFSMVSHGVELINGLILYMKQVSLDFPEISTLSGEVESAVLPYIEKLQSLIASDTVVDDGDNSVTESYGEEEFEEDGDTSIIKSKVIERIRNSSVLPDDEKEAFIDELNYEDLDELMGFEEEPELKELALSSEEEMAKAVENYVSWYENNYLEGEE